MSKHNEIIKSEAAAETENRTASADSVRRKILKAGAVGLPVTVTLHSGTAWAVSTCVTNMTRPNETQIDAALSDSNNQTIIANATGIKVKDIKKIAKEYSAVNPGAYFGDFGGTTSGEVLWLRVNNAGGGSCWTSFCDNAVDTGAFTVTGHKSDKVCNDTGWSGGDSDSDSDKGDSDKGDSDKGDSDKGDSDKKDSDKKDSDK